MTYTRGMRDVCWAGLGIRSSVFQAPFVSEKVIVEKSALLPLLFCHERPDRAAPSCSFKRATEGRASGAGASS